MFTSWSGSTFQLGTTESSTSLLTVRSRALRYPGQGVAVAAHAVALTSKGPAGSCRRHRSPSSSRRSAGSDARYAPAGPTPSVNVSHHDSNPAWRTRTVKRGDLDRAQPGLRE